MKNLIFKFMYLLIIMIPSLAFGFGGGNSTPAPTPISVPTTTSSRPPLTVMAYNIFHLSVGGDWDHSNRINRLAPAINNLASDPDVIVFSEAFTNKAEDVIKGLTKYPYHTEIVGKDCSGTGWDAFTGNCSNSVAVIRGGVIVVSKYPIVKKRGHVFYASHSGTWDYMSNKGFAYVAIDKQGYKYHIVGTHLQATEGDNNNEEHGTRMNQLSEMKAQIDQYGIPSNEPVIIAGDLNVEFSKSAEITEMLSRSQSVLSFPNNQGFGSYSGPKNWLTRANLYYSKDNLDYNDTLDYVISRTDYLQPSQPAIMTVVNLKSSDRWYWSYLKGWWTLSSGSYYHDGYHSELSDHFPVVATYRY